jgi:methionyl-tRNA synthetase
MADNILVSVAWPYANADIHVGNIVGAYLPADIFARYHRLAGNRVLMVSGTDAHGTPITVRADAEGTSPQAVYQRFHQRFLELFVKLGLSYDLFTTTHTRNHFQVSQDIFTALLDHGYLYRQAEPQWYAPDEGRFLPDRYVEGECYICHYPNARGDQCDNCGSLLDSTQLIQPRSKTGGALELRPTEHYYLDLAKLNPALRDYLRQGKEHWRANVLAPSRHTVESGELHGRAITRDLDWGIPVPLENFPGKCLYVWFEAVIGYLSASIEWAAHRASSRLSTLEGHPGGDQGRPEAWKDWWYEPAARAYYFIGKDNIPFHAVIWPAQLIGTARLYEDDPGRSLNLPYDVPANEFLNLEGQKISGSRNWAVWGLDVLERFDPDPLRFYLTAVMPEARDSEWEWADFVRRNNDELVATWGNLVNRVLSFTHRHFQGIVPEPGELGALDTELLAQVEAGFDKVGGHLQSVRLREALAEALALARAANVYLERASWYGVITTDRAAAARTVFTALRAIDSLKILFAPFLPFSAERLHAFFGYDQPLFGRSFVETYREGDWEHTALTYDPSDASGRWAPSTLEAGRTLRPSAPLFRKLEPEVAEEEVRRLKDASRAAG